jgi:hypothetical protein
MFYSERVDRHIYGIPGGCESVGDWMTLSLAALDQAGFTKRSSAKAKEAVERIAMEQGLEWDDNSEGDRT